MKRIVVASKNPVKIAATLQGFERMFPDEQYEIEGVSVPSGVRDQPLGNEEILTGAKNRAQNAQETQPHADFWVGMETGIEVLEEEMINFGWVVIRSHDRLGKGRTSSFVLPPAVADLIRQGKELGEADDIIFQRMHSAQENGAVGLLTGNIIDRTGHFTEATILALIPFKNPSYYTVTPRNEKK